VNEEQRGVAEKGKIEAFGIRRTAQLELELEPELELELELELQAQIETKVQPGSSLA
jgi:hypothetical protein